MGDTKLEVRGGKLEVGRGRLTGIGCQLPVNSLQGLGSWRVRRPVFCTYPCLFVFIRGSVLGWKVGRGFGLRSRGNPCGCLS